MALAPRTVTTKCGVGPLTHAEPPGSAVGTGVRRGRGRPPHPLIVTVLREPQQANSCGHGFKIMILLRAPVRTRTALPVSCLLGPIPEGCLDWVWVRFEWA